MKGRGVPSCGFLLFSIGRSFWNSLIDAGFVLFLLFDIWYLVVVAAVIALYIWFNLRGSTEWQVKIRKDHERPGHRTRTRKAHTTAC